MILLAEKGNVPVHLERARQVLASLEASRSTGSLDALPLFSYEPREPPAASAPDALRTALTGLDPDEMSPRDALEALYKLKRLGED